MLSNNREDDFLILSKQECLWLMSFLDRLKAKFESEDSFDDWYLKFFAKEFLSHMEECTGFKSE